MDSIWNAPHRVIAFWIAGALVGCGGGGSQLPDANPMQGSAASLGLQVDVGSARAPTSSLSGETLVSRNVKITNVLCNRGGIQTDFTASGKAKGPYPGTFNATGFGLRTKQGSEWIQLLAETFVLTSGTTVISGTIDGSDTVSCHGLDPSSRLGYRSDFGYGTATTSEIAARHRFRQSLH